MTDKNLDTRLPGRARVHFNARRGKARFCISTLHPDQAETIQQALSIARKEAGTNYDAVALELICLDYLATHNPRNSHALQAKEESE